MSRYVLLLGSNVNAEQQIAAALTVLEKKFGVLRLAEVFASADRHAPEVNPHYLNQAVEIATPNTPASLKQDLREIEKQLGRTRPAIRAGHCEIDIDIALCREFDRWIWLDQAARRHEDVRRALSLWLVSIPDDQADH
jgi:2-amino-4-hydroxy-6-hydroxymethyldihydropteridine diphosphokinase